MTKSMTKGLGGLAKHDEEHDEGGGGGLRSPKSLLRNIGMVPYCLALQLRADSGNGKAWAAPDSG